MTDEQLKTKSNAILDKLEEGGFDLGDWSIEDAHNNGFLAGYHECQKGHEWHNVKDGNPDNENDILCQISKDEVEVGYYHTKENRYYTIDGQNIDVIRWQEIVFPKESE